MKRILLLLIAVFTVNLVSAQLQKAPLVNYKIETKSSSNTVVNHYSLLSVQPAPLWSDDCSDQSTWVFTNSSLPPLDWNWTTNTDVSSQMVTGLPASLETFNSTTASNGYMIINSDAAPGNLDQNGTPIVAEFTNVQPIDLTGYQNVQLTFQHSFRWWNDTRGVRVSGDNGVTWTDFEISNATTYNTPNQNSDNPHISTYNISSIAGNQSQVLVQFYYDDNDYWGWYWTVDDVVIEEVPDNGLDCTNETFGGWWVGYQTLGDIGIDYTLYPMGQATANPYRMEAVLSNTGVNTQNNVTLHVDVEEPNGNINSYMSSPSNLVGAPNPMNDTTATTSNFSPSSMGVHNFTFWATSDSFPTTDTMVMSSIVTDTVYGVDYDWDGTGTNLGGGYYLGRPCGGQVLANVFDIYENTQLTSISFHVSASSVVGAKVTVEVYESDGQIYLEESDEYTLKAQDLGSWVTVPLLSPYPLFAGTGYMAAVRGVQHPTDTSLISASSNVNSSSFIQDNGCDIGTQGFGYWYTSSDPLAIRMNFGNVSSVNQELNSSLSVYPNPSNGIFTIENNNNEDINYLIRNILGQTTFSGVVNSFSNTNIDLIKLKSGIYTIEFDGKNKIFNQKLIIE
jgi:hypothetical protein